MPATEFSLYDDNVPHGVAVFGYGNWTTTPATITVTASTGHYLYVNTVGFIIDDAATASAGSITLAGGGLTSIVIGFAEFFKKIYALADPYTLKVMKPDDTNGVMIGEIKFNPPVKISQGATFTITPSGITGWNSGAYGAFFTIRGWEDTIA